MTTATATATAATVNVRHDFINCFTHANPTMTRKDVSALYDRMEKLWPEVSRGGHRGLVGRANPWENVEHECPYCTHTVHGIDAVKVDFGFRNFRGKVYVQSWCRSCRSAKRKGLLHTRINPEVREMFTNGPEAGCAPMR